MTDRSEIERLLNMTGRTLAGLPERYDIVRWNRAANMPGAPLDIICHQSDVIELLVGALRDALEEAEKQKTLSEMNRILMEEVVKLMPEWISTKDRLPEDTDRFYLAYMPRYHEYIIAEHEGDGVWADRADLANVTGDVTHWMPLPEPPEEEA